MRFWKVILRTSTPRKRDFPGHQPGEHVEVMTVHHWVSLAPFFFEAALLFAISAWFIASDLYSEITNIPRIFTMSIAVALFIHALCFRLYNYFLKVILVTNFRVIDVRHSVFLKREREAIPLLNIQDLRYQQNGIFQRVFQYGTLMILGASTDLKYVFRYVPRVNKFHHILAEVHQRRLREQLSFPSATLREKGLPPTG